MKKITFYLIVGLILGGKSLFAQTDPPAKTNDYQIAAGLKFGGYENGISGNFFE